MRNMHEMRHDRPNLGGTLIIVCGLPGSGKTTYSRSLATDRRAIRMCPDEWMVSLGLSVWDEQFREKVEALQWSQAQDLLTLDQTVVIEWGTWGRTERDMLRLDARALNAKAELHYLSARADLLFERIQKRGAENPPITRADIHEWSVRFQIPTEEEMALFDNFQWIDQC
jgi:predicted kinase